MLILRYQNRMLLGLLLLLILLLTGAAAAWYRLDLEYRLPPRGAMLVRLGSPAGA